MNRRNSDRRPTAPDQQPGLAPEVSAAYLRVDSLSASWLPISMLAVCLEVHSLALSNFTASFQTDSISPCFLTASVQVHSLSPSWQPVSKLTAVSLSSVDRSTREHVTDNYVTSVQTNLHTCLYKLENIKQSCKRGWWQSLHTKKASARGEKRKKNFFLTQIVRVRGFPFFRLDGVVAISEAECILTHGA